MKDQLQEIVKHTHGLGTMDLVKVTGTATETIFESLGDGNKVILHAKFNAPVPEFIGVFGMPNLGLLNTLLGIPEYQEDAKVTMVPRTQDDGKVVPSTVHFENKTGDFKNDYRLMEHNIISAKLASMAMKTVKWDVEFVPTVNAIMRLKFQQQINPQETSFLAKTENNKLVLYFGDPTSIAGNCVFHDNTTGKLTRSWSWPLDTVISVLSLSGDKTFKISDEGVLQIDVSSGLAVYNYMVPALTK